MLEHIFEDRANSKKASKQLEDNKRAPRTQET
jgi:hypothetical protein